MDNPCKNCIHDKVCGNRSHEDEICSDFKPRIDHDNKLKNQREEIRRLQKRLKDVTQSRDHWKREAKRIGKQLFEALNAKKEEI